MTNLDKLKELLGRMTPGQWYRKPNPNSMLVAVTAPTTGNRIYADCGSAYPSKDADGIAALRNLAEAMVGVCEEAAWEWDGEYKGTCPACNCDNHPAMAGRYSGHCSQSCEALAFQNRVEGALAAFNEALKREVGE